MNGWQNFTCHVLSWLIKLKKGNLKKNHFYVKLFHLEEN